MQSVIWWFRKQILRLFEVREIAIVRRPIRNGSRRLCDDKIKISAQLTAKSIS